MYEKKKQRGGKVSFEVKPAVSGKEGFVAGDFTNWKPVKMQRQEDGSFSAMLAMPAGVYQYKFLVDGRWMIDPDNSRFAISPIGTVNSVAHLE